MGKENFLKKAFLSPHPFLSKTFKKGDNVFVLHSAFNGYLCYAYTLNFVIFEKVLTFSVFSGIILVVAG